MTSASRMNPASDWYPIIIFARTVSGIGPSGRDMFGDEAFTGQYQIWNQAQFDESFRGRPRLLEEEPERVSLATLIQAWQAGLSKIVVIPCRGSYTRVIGQHALLVTAETRDDPERYTEALKQFQ
ncbi:MAG: hypothetical protein H7279_01660 [Microbacteriaceae bacterium]|nr:hypothetical protein [Microbacteriaceae bacterium]